MSGTRGRRARSLSTARAPGQDQSANRPSERRLRSEASSEAVNVVGLPGRSGRRPSGSQSQDWRAGAAAGNRQNDSASRHDELSGAPRRGSSSWRSQASGNTTTDNEQRRPNAPQGRYDDQSGESARRDANNGRPQSGNTPFRGGRGKYKKDSEDIDMMEISLDVKRFFRSYIHKKKVIEAEEFLCILNHAVDVEKDNDEVRHQFLIKLFWDRFLSPDGPISVTLSAWRDVPISVSKSKGIGVLLDLLNEIMDRIPHCMNVVPYTLSLLDLLTVFETQFRIPMKELRVKLDPNHITRLVKEPNEKWSADLTFLTENVMPDDMNSFLKYRLPERYCHPLKDKYSSAGHYLEMWYRTMSEDILGPLRDAIKMFIAGERKRLDGGYYYRIKRVIDGEKDEQEYRYLLEFETRKGIDWKNTDRLKGGSLMVLSKDGYKTARFATIYQHPDPDKKVRGQVWVQMIGGALGLKLRKECDAIESIAYYEPYRCVIERLKILAAKLDRGVDLPMQRYVVDCKCLVRKPVYLKGGTLRLPGGKQTNASSPVLEGLSLDDSQRKALLLALTHEFALIQGPPGTGKSYVGSLFVHILMMNRNLWQTRNHGCIMLMAFKNHAIDQFIGECERMGMDMSGTVRIGSRGDLSVQKYLLRNKRRELADYHEYNDLTRQFGRVRAELRNVERAIKGCEDDVLRMPIERLDFRFLCPFIPLYIIQQLSQFFLGEVTNKVLLMWLTTNFSDDDMGVEDKNRILIDLNSVEGYQDHEVNRVYATYPNAFQMPLTTRRKLFRSWCDHVLTDAQSCLYDLKVRENILKLTLRELRRSEDIAVARRANVLAMTTSGASGHGHVIEAAKPTILLVEEAAEVLESHIIAPLTEGCKHVVLIGDHQQLRPGISNYSMEKRNLSISLFERLINNEFPSRRLNFQHRMHPKIADVLRPHIYESLKDHASVSQYPEVTGMKQRLHFFCHSNPEERVGEKTSCMNSFEAEYVTAVCNHLLKQGYSPKEITILATYMGQKRLIRNKVEEYCTRNPTPLYTEAEKKELLESDFADYLEEMKKMDAMERKPTFVPDYLKKRQREYDDRKKRLSSARSKMLDVRISTVDNYQGEECKIILLSFVRSNSNGNIGFLKWKNRNCVALSRAKHGFYAIGNFRLFEKNLQSDLWRYLCPQLRSGSESYLSNTLYLECKNHGTVQSIVQPASIAIVSPDGGCQQSCSYRLRCGHTCTRYCHAYDPEHLTFICVEKCAGLLECGHPCRRRCDVRGDDQDFSHARSFQGIYRECTACGKKADCDVDVDFTPDTCDHEGRTKCSKVTTYVCKTQVNFDLSCGHSQFALCQSDVATIRCRTYVNFTLPCGHEQEALCQTNVQRILCATVIPVKLTCGHTINKKCSAPNPPCEEVVTVMLNCGHLKEKVCSQANEQLKCKVFVDVSLTCGHSVRVPCHRVSEDDFSGYECQVMVTLSLPCGHSTKALCVSRDSHPKCMQMVTQKLECGHEKSHPCYVQDPTCSEPVQKTLACGHTSTYPCCMKTPTCLRMLEKTLTCGHTHRFACSNTEPSCARVRQKSFPCGHTKEIKCHEYSLTLSCGKRVSEKLPCGHKYARACAEKLPTGYICKEDRSEIRQCGHYVRGKCNEIALLKSRPCSESVRLVKNCGHYVQVDCHEKETALSDPCEEDCLITCLHGLKCQKRCNKPCSRCIRPCLNKCVHSQCTKLCYEECNRDRCEEPCQEILVCGHDCPGFCGESCPTVCSQCRSNSRKGRRIRIIPCNHDFSPEFLDKHMKVRETDSLQEVVVKFCPLCESLITQCPRYANQVRRYLLLTKSEELRKKTWWYCKLGAHFMSSSTNEIPYHRSCSYFDDKRIEYYYDTSANTAYQYETGSTWQAGLDAKHTYRTVSQKGAHTQGRVGREKKDPLNLTELLVSLPSVSNPVDEAEPIIDIDDNEDDFNYPLDSTDSEGEGYYDMVEHDDEEEEMDVET